MAVSNQIVDTTALQAAIAGLTLPDMLEINKFLVGRIKHQRNVRSSQMKLMLCVGNVVSFTGNSGKTLNGKVVAIKRKFAHVDVGPNIWRVPMNTLTVVE